MALEHPRSNRSVNISSTIYVVVTYRFPLAMSHVRPMRRLVSYDGAPASRRVSSGCGSPLHVKQYSKRTARTLVKKQCCLVEAPPVKSHAWPGQNSKIKPQNQGVVGYGSHPHPKRTSSCHAPQKHQQAEAYRKSFASSLHQLPR